MSNADVTHLNIGRWAVPFATLGMSTLATVTNTFAAVSTDWAGLA